MIQGVLLDSRKYESASFICNKKSIGYIKEVVRYEFTNVKRMTDCKNSREWEDLAGTICNAFCQNQTGYCEFGVQNLNLADECKLYPSDKTA
jgi:hypothetical protein